MKIATFCGITSTGFLPPVERILREGGHETRRFTTPQEIHAGLEWMDAGWVEWLDSSAVLLSRTTTKPLVCRVHRYEADTGHPGAMSWQHTQLVVTSKHILARLIQRFPQIATMRTHVIASVVDFDAFPLVEGRDNAPAEVAVVGYREGRKQPGLAVAAFDRLQPLWPSRRARLRFIGTAKEPWWDRYLAVAPNIAIEPWTDDVADIWKTAEVCLSASADEGCPYNVIEAMASGAIPLVHGYEGSELQFPEECIWGVPTDAALALRRMRTWGSQLIRAWAAARYSIEANRDAVLNLFKEIA